MKSNIVPRVALLVGQMLLMGILAGCGRNTATSPSNGTPPAIDTESNQEVPADKVTEENENVPGGTPQGESSTYERDVTDGARPTPGNFPFHITLDGIDFQNTAGGTEVNHGTSRSTAYYFLRDRSKSVHEVCGNDHYSSAMKDIPNLIFTFLKEDPTLLGHDIYVGLGTFPNKQNDPPTVLELLAPTKVDQLSIDEWSQALDNTWNSSFTDDYDAAVFKDSITETVNKLAGVAADKKILVVFGDSMLDYPGGATEWNTLMPTPDGISPLTSLLNNNTPANTDDVELHYVQYDCLPDHTTRQAIRENFWLNGISNWQKLQGAKDRVDINQIDDEPLKVNDLIFIYGWKWYSSSIHQERVRANITSSLPPTWHIPSLLTNLLGSFLPTLHNSNENLWQLYRFYVESDEKNIEIPVPGYADKVTIHMLGFDSKWCVKSNPRYGNVACSSGERIGSSLVNKTFEISLDPPSSSCEGTMITLAPADDQSSKLKYPALVWWEIEPMSFPSIVGDISGVYYQSENDQEVFARSRTSIDLDMEWYGNHTPKTIEFLNHCYQVAIVPSGTTPDMSQGEYTLPRTVPFSFDPDIDPTLGFDLTFDVVVSRKINVPNFTDYPYTGDRTVVLSGSEVGLPVVHFLFTPTLDEPAELKVDGNDIVYTIPVNFTSLNYYPDEQAPVSPLIYLLRKNGVKSNDEECQAKPMSENEITLDEDRWQKKSLREGTGEKHLLNESIIEPGNSSQAFKINLVRNEIGECGYERLLITWENDAYPPIVCHLDKSQCEQIAPFNESEEHMVTTDDKD